MNKMQITLNQTEIEAALREYVNGRVTIQEGVQIIIDLKAGRGPEGFTATIDLVETAAAAPAKKVPALARIKPVEAPVAVEEAPQAPEASQEVVAEAETTPVAADQSDEPVASVPEANDRPAKSLFAGMQKPRNIS